MQLTSVSLFVPIVASSVLWIYRAQQSFINSISEGKVKLGRSVWSAALKVLKVANRTLTPIVTWNTSFRSHATITCFTQHSSRRRKKPLRICTTKITMSPAESGGVSNRYISKRNTKLTDLMMCPIRIAKKEHLIPATCWWKKAGCVRQSEHFFSFNAFSRHCHEEHKRKSHNSYF